jgi:hypothetical protein
VSLLTFVSHCVVAGHAEVVRCLLAFNSEPRWKNKQGINALGGDITVFVRLYIPTFLS